MDFIMQARAVYHGIMEIQVNLCQKLLFLHQLTHNMATDCSLNYEFSTCCVHKLFWMSKKNTHQKTICVHNMFSPCSEVAGLTYWTRNSMNNLSPYCGLVEARISASEKDLPVRQMTKSTSSQSMRWTRSRCYLQ